MTIAVLGATGAVGRHLAGMLAGFGLGPVRLGARNPAGSPVERVDVAVEASLAAFCRGASVVVNCAGPVRVTRPAVLRAAAEAGAQYLDSAPVRTGHAAGLFGAGAEPGVAELLVRWLAGPGPVRAVTGYATVLDVMTPAAAEDFLDGPRTGGGGAVRHHVPFFSEHLVAYPFVGPDTAAVADFLGVAEMSWFNLLDPASPVLAVLAGGHGNAGSLRVAANAWVGRQAPFQQFVVEAGGRVAVLRAGSTYRLTAATLAVAAGEVLAGRVDPAQRRAALALDPATLPRIADLADQAQLFTLDGPLSRYAAAETGSI